jgi:hypothetical protein
VRVAHGPGAGGGLKSRTRTVRGGMFRG